MKVFQELIDDSEYMGYFKGEHLELQQYEDTAWYQIVRERDDLYICPYYSSYYNATIYLQGEYVVVIILHNENIIYGYNKLVYYSYGDEAEKDKQWMEDFEKEYCEKLELSKENLFIAIKDWYIEYEK